MISSWISLWLKDFFNQKYLLLRDTLQTEHCLYVKCLWIIQKNKYFHFGTLEKMAKAFFNMSRSSWTIANSFLKMRFYLLDSSHAWPCLSLEMHFLYVLFAFFSILQAYGNWFKGLWLLHSHFFRWYDKLYCATFKFLVAMFPYTSMNETPPLQVGLYSLNFVSCKEGKGQT